MKYCPACKESEGSSRVGCTLPGWCEVTTQPALSIGTTIGPPLNQFDLCRKQHEITAYKSLFSCPESCDRNSTKHFKKFVKRDQGAGHRQIVIEWPRHVLIQKVMSEGVNVFVLCLFSWWGEGGSIYQYKRAFIGPPAKRHSNGVSLTCRWWPAWQLCDFSGDPDQYC